MWIIQMSDLHSYEGYTLVQIQKILNEISSEIIETIPNNETIAISICGDISNKGEAKGYSFAIDFFEQLKTKLNIYKSIKFNICPGNHDIVDNKFINFDEFNCKLSTNYSILYQKNSVSTNIIDDVEFVIVNSAFHRNPNFGEVNIEELSNVLSKCSPNNKVMMLHHHLIPTKDDKKSSITNAYEVLKMAELYNVSLILHGHQHMQMGIKMGVRNCNIIGVGTLLADAGTNYSNQFNIIQIENYEVVNYFCFKYNKEDITKGYLGRFNKFKMIL